MTSTRDELKPVYLILSEQRLLLDQAVARLKKRVGEDADLTMSMDTFDAEGLDADAVVVACNTLPFMSERRLVLVNNIEKINAAAAETLVAYAADPSPTTVLALCGEKLAKNTRLYKAVDKLGGLLERKAPKRSELPTSVRSMFADRGKEISLEAAALFVDSVGSDLQRLSAEIDKTVSYVGVRTEVTRTDVEEIAATTAKRSIFDFTDALADRDARRCLVLASTLLADGDSEYAIWAMSLRLIRDLIAVQALMERGLGGATEIARELGKQDWLVKKLMRQARGFPPGELSVLLRLAAEADAQTKTGRDSRLVLERWIVRACGG